MIQVIFITNLGASRNHLIQCLRKNSRKKHNKEPKNGGVYLNSVYSEIEKIRHEQFFKQIESLTNRYCIHCQEPNGIKTAYCFSVPIRNNQSNNIVELKFHHQSQGLSIQKKT